MNKKIVWIILALIAGGITTTKISSWWGNRGWGLNIGYRWGGWPRPYWDSWTGPLYGGYPYGYYRPRIIYRPRRRRVRIRRIQPSYSSNSLLKHKNSNNS